MFITITADSVADLVAQLLPRFEHGEDNDGQLIMFTDHHLNDDGAVVLFDGEGSA
jgi:hypothetical protein